MINQYNVFKTWLQARMNIDDRGANLVEYILLVAFIALLVIGAVFALRGAIDGQFNDASSCLNDASATRSAC